MLGQVLAEKENYIQNLEGEITEMRREIENQRSHLIGTDINTLTESMPQTSFVSIGANKISTTLGQGSIY